jgi:hypothetical protein
MFVRHPHNHQLGTQLLLQCPLTPPSSNSSPTSYHHRATHMDNTLPTSPATPSNLHHPTLTPLTAMATMEDSRSNPLNQVKHLNTCLASNPLKILLHNSLNLSLNNLLSLNSLLKPNNLLSLLEPSHNSNNLHTSRLRDSQLSPNNSSLHLKLHPQLTPRRKHRHHKVQLLPSLPLLPQLRM